MNCSDDQVREWLTSPQVDLIEWRLDSFLRKRSVTALQESLSILSRQPRNPVIATNRSRIGGGFFEGSEEGRLQVLQLAAHAGADWVDLEEWVSEENLVPFQALEVPILLSYHDFDHTPERSVLLAQLERMAGKRPTLIKMVTRARTPEDNLRVLELIPLGRQQYGIEVIAFCMGSVGRWSRLACLMLGSPWTYVQLPGVSVAADGQISTTSMQTLLTALTS
jgi:3-dehydroquinate dehydratase I